MQSGSSKLLYRFYALAHRGLAQQEFHTTACILKGGPREKKKTFKGKGAPRLARSPARKRLVPNLRPSSRSGTYEVAPRVKARSEGSRGREVERGVGARAGKPPMRTSTAGSGYFRGEGGYERPRRDEAYTGRPVQSQGEARFTRDSIPHRSRAPSAGLPRRATESGAGSRSFRGEGGYERPRRDEARPVPSQGENRFTRDNVPRRSEAPSPGSRRRTFESRAGSGSFRGEGGYEQPRRREAYAGRPVPFQGENRFTRDSVPRRSGAVSAESPRRFPAPDRPRTPLPAEFETPTSEPLKTLPSRFSSPPLLEGLFQSVHDVLGADARPSPIQSLSLKHLFTPPSHLQTLEGDDLPELSPSSPPSWSQYLLASETGSGKSMAYLLPMLQYLKLTEHNPAPLLPSAPPPPHRLLPLNPRGLILAPTHELSRQLSSFAKALLHHVRLRVLCTSRANTASSSRGKSSTASQLKRELDESGFGMTGGAPMHLSARENRPVDIVVGTPMKMLEMVRGWGWDREGKIEEQWDDARKERARKWIPGPPEAGLANVEWVVVDEADVLFDADFQESTRLLLADIARARGYVHPSFSSLSIASGTPPSSPTPPEPLAYPFHLLLTSATIPSSLATYLSTHHPALTRLASPNLHHLPRTLKTEHHGLTSGNKNSDIEKRLRRVWSDDASMHSTSKSKVLIFCNRSSKVDDLGLYLKEKGIPNVALTSTGQARHRGSNRHLAGFLKSNVPDEPEALPTSPSDPHVMITTSLLSRGLDFSPQIKHVFITDEPRNMIDFLHRAGRSGRAGHEGKVVIFGRTKGRGAGNAREVRRKVGALA